VRNAATGFVGAVVEAWAELRIHRTRVLLALVGVAVAVCALTTVVGLGAVAEQAQREFSERGGGRPATLSISAYAPDTGMPPPYEESRRVYAKALERYGITYSTTMVYTGLPAQFPDGVRDVGITAVDADYGTMHRVPVEQGRWFDDSDAARLAPALVVNDAFLAALGVPDLRSTPSASLVGLRQTTAVVTGVVPNNYPDEGPTAYMLLDAFERVAGPEAVAQAQPNVEAWVPPEIADELAERLRGDIASALGDGMEVSINRNDYAAFGEDPFLPIKLLVGGVAALVLLLGALGLVNISLVTVRQRIREIGVRRSFGATASRVFFAVLMESVVATMAAGVVGVLAAIAIVKSPWVTDAIGQGVIDLPPFPVGAAVLGLAASLVVGAIAGLLPALVAVRVKVIDAIRY
jgi:putative ABC transport system permease protein